VLGPAEEALLGKRGRIQVELAGTSSATVATEDKAAREPLAAQAAVVLVASPSASSSAARLQQSTQLRKERPARREPRDSEGNPE
jgi:hypothetical protein